MKTLLLSYTSAFLIFGIIGFLSGHSDVSKSEFLEAQIFKHLELVILKGSPDRNRQVDLVYRVDDAILYRFNVDSNELTPTADHARLELKEGFTPAVKFPLNETLLLSLLGGSTGGFTVKDVLKNPKKKMNTLAAILGGLSGYSLGYKLGTTGAPLADSKEVRDILNEEENWIEIERKYAKLVVLKAFRAANQIKDEDVAEKRKTMVAALWALLKNKKDLGAIDLIITTNKFNQTARLAAGSWSGSSPATETNPFWLSWWWIGGVVAILLSVFCSLLYIEHRKKNVSSREHGDS